MLGVARAVTTGRGIAGTPDLGHSIHDNLVYFLGSHPAGSDPLGKEQVSNEALTTFGAAAFTGDHPTEAWKCLDTPGASGDGAWNTLLAGVAALGTQYTFYADVEFTSVGAWAKLLSVPWNTAWSGPFGAFTFGRASTTTEHRHDITDSGSTEITTDSAAGGFPTALERKRLWFIRDGATVTFGLNGATVGIEHNNFGASDVAGWGSVTSDRITIGNRSPFSTGDACGMRVYRMMLLGRVATVAEMQSLNTDPLLGLNT